MLASRIRHLPIRSEVTCEMTGQVASWHSPAVRPAAVLVVCSAARCISLACARAPQHEHRHRARRADGHVLLDGLMGWCVMATRRLPRAGCGARGVAAQVGSELPMPLAVRLSAVVRQCRASYKQ